MIEDERQEALENIKLIKEMIIQTKRSMSHSGGGWIAILWGLFCIIGISGQKIFKIFGAMEGLWWGILTVIAVLSTYLVVRARTRIQTQRTGQDMMRRIFLFWLPLVVLAYTLTLFCVFLPGLSTEYITIFIFLVVSTGYLILGFLFAKRLLIMGILGMLCTIITAIFFLEYSDIILNLFFGIGLILTGIVINRKWQQ